MSRRGRKVGISTHGLPSLKERESQWGYTGRQNLSDVHHQRECLVISVHSLMNEHTIPCLVMMENDTESHTTC